MSLHPDWQLRILDFYKKLFSDESGSQTSQLFVATHSPFVIHNDNRYNDKVIILAKDEDGNIYIKNDNRFYDWTGEKLVEEAFSIDFNKFIVAGSPIVFVEGTTDIDYIKKAADFLGKNEIVSKIEIEDGGGKNLDSIWNGLVNASNKIFSQKVLLLYDCDVRKNPSQSKNLLRNTICYCDRKYIQKGIENLFPDSLIESALKYKPAFLDVFPPPIIRGVERSIAKFKLNPDEKRNLCNWICENATADDFKDFEQVFQTIDDSLL